MTVSTTGGDHKAKEKVESLWFNYDPSEKPEEKNKERSLFDELL
jgi:hypothetical protein